MCLYVGRSDDPCYKNPCKNIARAVVDSCMRLDNTDFVCKCQQHFIWDDDNNDCVQGCYSYVIF